MVRGKVAIQVDSVSLILYKIARYHLFWVGFLTFHRVVANFTHNASLNSSILAACNLSNIVTFFVRYMFYFKSSSVFVTNGECRRNRSHRYVLVSGRYC